MELGEKDKAVQDLERTINLDAKKDWINQAKKALEEINRCEDC